MDAIWVAGVILLGTFVQGLAGFGLALVSVPLLSLVLDVKVAVPVAGVFGWLVTLPLVFKMRAHVQWRTCVIMVAGALPGTWLGVNALKLLPARWILVAMGIVLVASSAFAFWHRTTTKHGTARAHSAVLAGFASGTLGAAVGEPGPPVIAYTSMLPWTADQMKASLLFFFSLQMIGALAGFWNKGLLTPEVGRLVGWGVPCFVVGLLLGIKAWDLLKHRQVNYHAVVHGFLACIGAYLIVKHFFFAAG